MIDLASLTDEELDAHLRSVLIEQERRQKLQQLPNDLATIARDAVTAGCDPDVLRERVDDALNNDPKASQ